MDLASEYDNRARVPEHPQIMQGWSENAARFRAAAGGECNLSYGPEDRHVCDIFRSKDDTAHAMAVFIHGGYWQALDKSSFSHLAAGLEIHGVSLAIPSYRLCPSVHVADIIDDLRQFCMWLWRRHKRHLVIAGHSAGGHLAAAMLATDWEALGGPDDLVLAGLGISGLYDLRPLIATPLNKALKLNDGTARKASPLLWSSPRKGAFEAWVGGDESAEFLRQSATIAAAWAGAGLRAHYAQADGLNHFTIVEALCDPNHSMTQSLATLCDNA